MFADSITDLESRVSGRLYSLSAKSDDVGDMFLLLGPLKAKHVSTYVHSLRVGILTADIARYMHLDEKAALLGGCLHDVGKSLVRADLLGKTENFSQEDMNEMRKHALYSSNLLSGRFEYCSEIVKYHHFWQENGYPKKLPKPRVEWSESTELGAKFLARILSLADFYDAATNRVNEKFGEKQKLTREQVKEIMLIKNQDQKRLIEELYNNQIIGEEEPQYTDAQAQIYDYSVAQIPTQRTPRLTGRNVTIACCLEPLSDKVGCTRRGSDISRHLPIEYFIVAARNIEESFVELATRCDTVQDGQPLIYDLAYTAQLEGTQNRSGGRINQGIIEFLTPIIAAQHLYDRDYSKGVEGILAYAVSVLKATTEQDVKRLVEMKRIANQLCGYDERKVDENGAASIFEFYKYELAASQKKTSLYHNGEFVNGFPVLQYMYDVTMNSKEKRFLKKVEEAYIVARNGAHKDVGPGLTADLCACVIYLSLSQHPKDRLVI